MSIQIQKISDLPVQELSEMLVESQMAGFRAIDRLIKDWMTEVNRFDRLGEVLLLAWQADRVVGVCGLNQDPYVNLNKIGRVRRLYVMQDSRRQGIGRMLIHQIIRAAKPSFDGLHVRTTNPVAAQFYRAIGFTTCNDKLVTHALNLATVQLEELQPNLLNAVQDRVL